MMAYGYYGTPTPQQSHWLMIGLVSITVLVTAAVEYTLISVWLKRRYRAFARLQDSQPGVMQDVPWDQPVEKYNGLTTIEFTQLSVYNDQRSAGLMHTAEWDAKMAELQRRYNRGVVG